MQLAILSWVTTKIEAQHIVRAIGTSTFKEALEVCGLTALSSFFFQHWKSSKIMGWVEKVEKKEINIIIFGDKNYPKLLYDLPNPPLLLSTVGEVNFNNELCLSIVGSRNPSQLSLRWMESHLPHVLLKKEVIIISGGAKGLDQKAHYLAITSGRKTVSVLPVGLKYRYPKNFEPLENAIIKSGGAILSPFPPDTPLYKSNFWYRNQIIAALGKKLFVVEANRKSGSLLTAKLAIDIGRSIATLPISPMAGVGLGGLDLIVDGCQPLRDSEDLMIFLDQ